MSKRELILQAILQASMCWTGTPAGIFDSERAIAICDKLIEDLDRYDEEAHAEYMANLSLESEVTE